MPSAPPDPTLLICFAESCPIQPPFLRVTGVSPLPCRPRADRGGLSEGPAQAGEDGRTGWRRTQAGCLLEEEKKMPGTSSQRPARARAINPFSVIYHPVNSTRATPKEAITRPAQTPSRDAMARARRRGRVYTSDKQALAITAALAPRRHAQRPSMIAGTALPPRELPRPDLLPVMSLKAVYSELQSFRIFLPSARRPCTPTRQPHRALIDCSRSTALSAPGIVSEGARRRLDCSIRSP